MPYFVFKLTENNRKAEHIETLEEFAKAKQLVREERGKLQAGEAAEVRMVFAKSQKEAAELLTTPRKPSTPVEEWEE